MLRHHVDGAIVSLLCVVVAGHQVPTAQEQGELLGDPRATPQEGHVYPPGRYVLDSGIGGNFVHFNRHNSTSSISSLLWWPSE